MLKSIGVKLKILAKQKHYGANKIKYIFEKKYKTAPLVVVFSGFSAAGEPAKYNYMRTLEKLRVNKLFILDDFGYLNRGSYYLVGRSKSPSLQEEIEDLISHCRCGNKLITAGSSKGGYAALFYGIKCEADYAVVGAPQYYLGDYLATDEHLKILEGITGDTTEASVNALNALLRDRIYSAEEKKINVYVHCSPLEHTYEEHVKDLISDLCSVGIPVIKDLNSGYSEHRLLSRHFPPFLVDSIQNITSQ